MKKIVTLIVSACVLVCCMLFAVNANADTIYSFDKVYSDNIIDSTCSHNWVNMQVDEPHTCYYNSIVHYTCSNCGSTYYTTLNDAGHDYKYHCVPATADNDGYTEYRCQCGMTKDYNRISSVDKITLSQESFVFDGAQKYPAVTIYDYMGNIISPEYYDVSYSDNVSAGICTVTADFKGLYQGKMTASFVIRPKATTLSSVKYKSTGKMVVKWKKAAAASGYVIQYSTSSKFNDEKKWCTVTVSGQSTTSKTISNLPKVKYYIRVCPYVTINGSKLMGDWSKAKTVTIKKGASMKQMINATKSNMDARKDILMLTRNGVDIKKYKTTYDRFKAIFTWHAKHQKEFANCMECNMNFNDCIYALYGCNRKNDIPIYLAAGNFKNRNGSIVMHKWSVINIQGVPYVFDPRIQGYGNYKGMDYFGLKVSSSTAKSRYLLDGYWFYWADGGNLI